MIESAIMAWLLAQPIHRSDSGETERYSRISQVAEAIGVASAGDRRIAALLAVTAHEESALRRDLAEGRPQPGEHDDGRARGLWALHRPPSLPRATWLGWAGEGYQPLLSGAAWAAGYYRYGLAKCGTIEGSVALYATGNRCQWSGAKRRADRARELERKL